MTATTSNGESVEVLKLSEHAVQNLPAFSQIFGNDSGISGDSIHEKASSSGSITLTSSEDEIPEVVQTTIMAQLSETECHVTLLHENGELVPFRTKDSTKSFTTIPLKMGIVRNKVLVYGEEVQSYENAKIKKPDFWGKRFIGFNLWEQLLDSSRSLKIFSYDYNPVTANAELLLGLYLENLKNMVENFLNGGANSKSYQVHKIIFLVPLSCTSLHRQRMKDAAEIGGFLQSFICNQTTALALIHMAAKKLVPGTPLNLLIFSEYSGHTELTFHSCEVDSFANMLAVTGNRISSSQNAGYAQARDADKINCEEIMKTVKHEKKELFLKKYMFRCLLGELTHQLSNGIDPIQFVDCILLSHSDKNDWKVVMQEELQRKHIIHYEHIGSPPVGVPSQHWRSPVISIEDFVGAHEFKISDLVPLSLQQSVSVNLCGGKTVKIGGKITKDLYGKLTAYPMEHSVFYQKDVLGQSWAVGTIQIKPLLYFDHEYPIVETSFRQSPEGIFYLDSVIASNASGNHMKILNGDTGDFSWMPFNLTTRKKEECAKKLREMMECSQRYKEERSKVIEELWSTCGEIGQRLWWGEHSEKLRGKRKVEMEKEVDTTLKMLKEMCTNNLMEIGRDELKNKLRLWRREYRTYFLNVMSCLESSCL